MENTFHSPHTWDGASLQFLLLAQAEKRLNSEKALEDSELKHKASSSADSESPSSLSTPLYLLSNHRITNDADNNNLTTTLQDSSVPFFSHSLPTPHQNPRPVDPPDSSNSSAEHEIDDVGDIGRLIQLLGLANNVRTSQEKSERRNLGGGDGSFYEKVVGVKGPKCEKEEERLDGWIEHLMNSNGRKEVKEPLRLAHLLLGKAAFLYNNGEDCGFGGLEYPNTIEKFLQNDPTRLRE